MSLIHRDLLLCSLSSLTASVLDALGPDPLDELHQLDDLDE